MWLPLQDVPMKLAEFIDNKLAGWDEHLKVKAAPIRNWAHMACTLLLARDKSKGSAMQQKWRLFVNTTDESFN